MSIRDSVELIFYRRMLKRLRIEGTSIVLRDVVDDDDDLRAAVVEGRSFVDEEGSYVVLKRAAPMPSQEEPPIGVVLAAVGQKMQREGVTRSSCFIGGGVEVSVRLAPYEEWRDRHAAAPGSGAACPTCKRPT